MKTFPLISKKVFHWEGMNILKILRNINFMMTGRWQCITVVNKVFYLEFEKDFFFQYIVSQQKYGQYVFAALMCKKRSEM